MKKISYSQNFEDIILARTFSNVESGSYIDVGAHDPVIDSVTNLFYQQGWSGINIEPQRDLYERLCKVRSRDINLNICAGNYDGVIEFATVTNRTGWSSGSLDQLQLMQKNKELEIAVESCAQSTVTSILNEYPLNEIHFMKIDVEGSELEVIEGMDFSKVRPWVLVIEATVPGTQIPNFESWEQLLFSAEYEFVYADGLNRFYVSRDHPELKESFLFPPNSFDDFESQYTVVARQERDDSNKLANELANEVAELKKEVNSLLETSEGQIQKIQYLENKLFEVHNSLSWKVTKPLRLLASIILFR